MWSSQAVSKLSREGLGDNLEMFSRDREAAKMPGICCPCTFQAVSFVRHLKASIKMEMLSGRSNALSHYLSLIPWLEFI